MYKTGKTLWKSGEELSKWGRNSQRPQKSWAGLMAVLRSDRTSSAQPVCCRQGVLVMIPSKGDFSIFLIMSDNCKQVVFRVIFGTMHQGWLRIKWEIKAAQSFISQYPSFAAIDSNHTITQSMLIFSWEMCGKIYTKLSIYYHNEMNGDKKVFFIFIILLHKKIWQNNWFL